MTHETNSFSPELAHVEARQNELLALVQLYEALGGGWQQWGDHAARNSEGGYCLKRVGDSSISNIEIAVDHIGEDTIVHLKGRVDVDSSPDVRDRLRAILLTNPLPHAVSVDLAGVTSIEASGIATLIEALKVARQRAIRFHLHGHGSVLQLFESTGLLALFDKSSGGNGVS